MSDYPEAYLVLEQRLVADLISLQGGGNPLDGLAIYPGHSEQDLDNIATYCAVYSERADTQPLWQGSIEIIDVRIMLSTQADDTALAVHNRRVGGLRTVYDLRNLPGLKARINALPGFGLSGWKAGTPPIEDGFDSTKRRRQALFRFQAQCGIEL